MARQIKWPRYVVLGITWSEATERWPSNSDINIDKTYWYRRLHKSVAAAKEYGETRKLHWTASRNYDIWLVTNWKLQWIVESIRQD